MRGSATDLVSAVVLAAGPSSRFGESDPKQLIPIRGVPMVRRMVDEALKANLLEVIVVIGYAADRVRSVLAALPVHIVENPRFGDGQSSSVKLGMQAVDRRAAAVIFLLADQPNVSAELIRKIVGRYRTTRAPIVVPVSDGRRGAPVLFDRALFAEFEGLEGDVGGRQLFDRHASSIVEIQITDDSLLQDVDTPADLRRLGY